MKLARQAGVGLAKGCAFGRIAPCPILDAFEPG
jgi:hypothetical protein